MTNDQTQDKTEQEKYFENLDELDEGLLESYAAGFSKAVKTFGIDTPFDTDVRELRENGAIAKCHYYYWDGRTKPLEFWLEDQFDFEFGPGRSDEE